jgi:hypothetical protein
VCEYSRIEQFTTERACRVYEDAPELSVHFNPRGSIAKMKSFEKGDIEHVTSVSPHPITDAGSASKRAVKKG